MRAVFSAGPNNIMQETLAFYYHSKYSVKESQALVRIPETLVCAMEFIIMPTPSEQVRRRARSHGLLCMGVANGLASNRCTEPERAWGCLGGMRSSFLPCTC